MSNKIISIFLTAIMTFGLNNGRTDNAAAKSININFMAIVNGIYDPYYWLANVAMGDTIWGWYAYDSNSADIDPSSERGLYEFFKSPNGLMAQVSDFIFQTDSNNVSITFILGDSLSDGEGLSSDVYEFTSNNNVESTYGYMYMGTMHIKLRDDSKIALQNDSIPLDPPSLNDWPDLNQLYIAEQSNIWRIWAYLDSVWIDPPSSCNDPIQISNISFRNYPNPFSSSTTISYNLIAPTRTTLTIYNILGQEIVRFSNSAANKGLNTFIWNGLDMEGQPVASGIYFYNIEVSGMSATKKMVLLR